MKSRALEVLAGLIWMLAPIAFVGQCFVGSEDARLACGVFVGIFGGAILAIALVPIAFGVLIASGKARKFCMVVLTLGVLGRLQELFVGVSKDAWLYWGVFMAVNLISLYAVYRNYRELQKPALAVVSLARPELLEYLKAERARATPDTLIRQNLISNGWSPAEVDSALANGSVIAGVPVPPATSSTVKPSKKKDYSKWVLLAIVCFIGWSLFETQQASIPKPLGLDLTTFEAREGFSPESKRELRSFTTYGKGGDDDRSSVTEVRVVNAGADFSAGKLLFRFDDRDYKIQLHYVEQMYWLDSNTVLVGTMERNTKENHDTYTHFLYVYALDTTSPRLITTDNGIPGSTAPYRLIFNNSKTRFALLDDVEFPEKAYPNERAPMRVFDIATGASLKYEFPVLPLEELTPNPHNIGPISNFYPLYFTDSTIYFVQQKNLGQGVLVASQYGIAGDKNLSLRTLGKMLPTNRYSGIPQHLVYKDKTVFLGSLVGDDCRNIRTVSVQIFNHSTEKLETYTSTSDGPIDLDSSSECDVGTLEGVKLKNGEITQVLTQGPESGFNVMTTHRYLIDLETKKATPYLSSRVVNLENE